MARPEVMPVVFLGWFSLCWFCMWGSEDGAYVDSGEELNDCMDERLAYTLWGGEVGAFAGC